MKPLQLVMIGLRLFKIIMAHGVMFTASYFIAFCALSDFRFSLSLSLVPFWKTVWMILILKLVVGYFFSSYRGWWRYVGLADMVSIASQVTTCSGILLVLKALEPSLLAVSIGVILVDWAFTLVMLLTVRALPRCLKEKSLPPGVMKLTPALESGNHLKSAIILGAGDCGEELLRDIQNHPELGIKVVGFLDDDPAKIGCRIHCVSVLGFIPEVSKICAQNQVTQIFVAIPSATRKQLRRIIELLVKTGIPYKIVPALDQWVSGQISVSQIREVQIEDLLRRNPVQTDLARIQQMLTDRVILVTGAGGSIGSELCRQILKFNPSKLILAEQAENSLFYIEQDLLRSSPEAATRIVPAIVDIVDFPRLREIFSQYRPTTIFHAAAHKHVPMMEMNPSEAVKNNVFGTKNVVDLAHRFKCEAFVMISTDKAVNPTSVMGTTKRMAEMYVQALNEISSTKFMTVRFGNVLGSAGSVIPTFKEQIRRGGPVTVTHPDMRRYFMTIPEAVQLVLQSYALGTGGEIFTLDMGEQVKIADLARDLIHLSGLRPDEDIEIVYTSLRPGEKLYEELLLDGEYCQPTGHPQIRIAKSRKMNLMSICQKLDSLPSDFDNCSPETIKLWLKKMVPEYTGISEVVPVSPVKANFRTDQTRSLIYEPMKMPAA